jgi:hypothetical protein
MIAPALADQINALLAQATARSVPSGMLAWWGRTDFPDGQSRTPVLSQTDWEGWYLRLQQAALVPGSLPPLPVVKAMTNAIRPDEALPVAIANFRVAAPRAALVQRVQRAAAAGAALDPAPGELGQAIEERRVFMASGLLHEQWARPEPEFRGRAVTYVLDPRFYFANAGDPLPDQIELDPGDGRGFRGVRFGGTVASVYEHGDAAQVSVRCRIAGNMLCTKFSLRLGAQPAAPAPDAVWPLQGANGSTGTAYVYCASGRAQVSHPLIIAEPFPGGYPYDYLYELMNQHATLEALRAAGYDVILLGFGNGLDLMQNNAQVVVACIQEAMRRTRNALVVGGVSMGGLVTRYALAQMESLGVPHNTRIFLSVDAPHRGSYTSLGDQWFAQYFSRSSPMAALQAFAVDSAAMQQFVMTWVHAGAAMTSPLRQQFVQELEQMGGYPRKPHRLAVACGSGNGIRTIAPRQQTLDWTGSAFASARLWTLSEGEAPSGIVGQAYSFLADPRLPDSLSVAAEVSWEGAPGGQNMYNSVVAAIAASLGCGAVNDPFPRTCAVPTVSALDLSTSPFEPVPPPGSNASPFHDYVCCDENELHLQFTPKIKDWLLDRLGHPAATN